MCGIVGILDLHTQQRPTRQQIQRMTAAIQHRGPDGDGFYQATNLAMGMRRLSIIDIDGSEQPLYNENQRLAMVFNGEIYNYRELQQQLQVAGHHLQTDGDGETILHLYEMYGLDCLRYLRGMYSLALWDSDAERLILAVDHIGMKPLYLHEHQGLLYFASEIKALFAQSDRRPELNTALIDTYLAAGYPIGEETLFEGVRRLMPGHMLIAEGGQTRTIRYWRPGSNYDLDSSPEISNLPEAESVQLLQDKLRESIKLHLRSDVPSGLFLSGGIDSATMLALMTEQSHEQIRTYTVGFAGNTPNDEAAQAQRIATHFKTKHTACTITPHDWWDGLRDYAYYHDEPNANPSAISMLLLSQRTAQDVKVVLTGLGGDELFGGYPSHHLLPVLLNNRPFPGQQILADALATTERFYPALKRYRIIGAIPNYAPRLRHRLLPPDEAIRRSQLFDGTVFSDSLRQTLYRPGLYQTWQHAQHKEQAYQRIMQTSTFEQDHHSALALVMNTWLMGNALLSQDKVTMAHSLEARVPFFDPALLAFAFTLSPDYMLKGNKYLLREAMRGIVPEFARLRSKQPFSTPIRGWFEHDLKDNIEAVLRDSGALCRELFQTQPLDKLLNQHFNGTQKHEEVIFRLLNLELWYDAFIRNPRFAPTPEV